MFEWFAQNTREIERVTEVDACPQNLSQWVHPIFTSIAFSCCKNKKRKQQNATLFNDSSRIYVLFQVVCPLPRE